MSLERDEFTLTDSYIISAFEPKPEYVEALSKVNAAAGFDPVASKVRVFLGSNEEDIPPQYRGPFSMTLNGDDHRVPQNVWAGLNTYPGGREVIYISKKICEGPLTLFTWIYAHEVRHVLVRIQSLRVKASRLEYDRLRRTCEHAAHERQLESIEEFDAEIFAKTICTEIINQEEMQRFMHNGADGEQTVEYFTCLHAREASFGDRLPKAI